MIRTVKAVKQMVQFIRGNRFTAVGNRKAYGFLVCTGGYLDAAIRQTILDRIIEQNGQQPVNIASIAG